MCFLVSESLVIPEAINTVIMPLVINNVNGDNLFNNDFDMIWLVYYLNNLTMLWIVAWAVTVSNMFSGFPKVLLFRKPLVHIYYASRNK